MLSNWSKKKLPCHSLPDCSIWCITCASISLDRWVLASVRGNDLLLIFTDGKHRVWINNLWHSFQTSSAIISWFCGKLPSWGGVVGFFFKLFLCVCACLFIFCIDHLFVSVFSFPVYLLHHFSFPVYLFQFIFHLVFFHKTGSDSFFFFKLSCSFEIKPKPSWLKKWEISSDWTLRVFALGPVGADVHH